MVEEISVILENKPGQLAKLTQLLSKDDINLKGISVSTSNSHSVVRILCDRPTKAFELLMRTGYATARHQVIAVEMRNTPGALAEFADQLGERRINIEYLYAAIPKDIKRIILVFRVDKIDEAITSLDNNSGFKILGDTDIAKSA